MDKGIYLESINEVGMKKLIIGCLMAGFAVFGAMAEEQEVVKTPPVQQAPWFIGFNDVQDVDIVGLHLNFNGHIDQMTGFELGFAGHANNFYGMQMNLLRNEVVDVLAGFQIGIGWNSAGRADIFGMQVGLWNGAGQLKGIQVGLINTAEFSNGFQVGLINRTEGMYGFQLGAINVIRDSQIPFCPILNVGF